MEACTTSWLLMHMPASSSGVAMGCRAGYRAKSKWRGDGVQSAEQSSGVPPSAGPRVPGKKIKKNNFPVTVKIRTSAQNLQKCVWRPGSDRTRWGSYSALPDPLAVISGRRRRSAAKHHDVMRQKAAFVLFIFMLVNVLCFVRLLTFLGE